MRGPFSPSICVSRSLAQAMRGSQCASKALTAPNADGFVHDGDVVNLLSKGTESFVAVDVSDNLGKADMVRNCNGTLTFPG